VVVCLAVTAAAARAQTAARSATFRFTPTARAQIAIWIESADGARFATVRLTQAVSLRGIGNRPGASQMNSGYHWPYGRREGVLPVWAHRRAAVPGATLFPRVIFQRRPEGYASRICEDSTPDSYFCLSFSVQTTRKTGLDAITCASPFNSDKGRIMTAADVASGYSEPSMIGKRPLPLDSLYPPRRDFVTCADASTMNTCMGGSSACQDHTDSGKYADMARTVMPDIDAITMATPPEDQPVAITFPIPSEWPDGDYLAYLEVNTEGDYNESYNDTLYPTPMSQDWDSWALSYGYPFRGQPSVVFKLAIHVGNAETVSAAEAFGYGSLSGVGSEGGTLWPLDATISDNATAAPGSGVDRLRVSAGNYRLRLELNNGPPDAGVEPDGGVGSDGGAGPDAADASPGDAPAATDAGADSRPPPPPLCVPGRTVACACVGGGEGAQTCADDGNRYQTCQCSPLAPRDGCGCSCDIGGGAAAPTGLVLFALVLWARRQRRNRHLVRRSP